MPAKSEFKNFLSRLVFVALVGALIVFVYSLFLPKVWQVSGKIVIVPSGSSATAGQNLYLEAANAAEMISGPSFQKNVLGEDARFFVSAGQIGNSSTVTVNFEGQEDDIQVIEDAVVKIPENISSYAREIYQGSPFKYLLVIDPEVSEKPVKPNMTQNVAWGFAAGAVLFLLYWLFAEPFAAGRKVKEEKEENFVSPAVPVLPVEPAFKPQPELGIKLKSKPESEKRLKETVAPQKKIISPIGAAPSNLPIAETPSVPETSEYHEPSDEEVKERLNKLMRGEL